MQAKAFLDLIQQPAVAIVIVLVSLSLLFWSFAMLMSAINNEGLRIILLITMTVGIAAVGFHADTIFGGNDKDFIVQNFLLNLTTEFVSALIVIPALYAWWTRDRHWWSGKLAMSLLFAVGFTVIALFVMQYTGTIPSAIFQPSVEVSRILCLNLAVEIFSTLIIFTIAAIFVSFVALITSESLVHFALALLDAVLVALLVIFYIRFGQIVANAQEDFQNQLFTGIWGAIMTTIILGTWVTSNRVLLPLIGAVVIVAICILIIGVTDFGQNFSVNISAELLGALIAGVLIEGGWNQKKARESG